MATNCLGPYLLNTLLTPILQLTAKISPPNAVRILWLTSFLAYGTSPNGIEFDDSTNTPKVLPNSMENYMQSKVGNTLLAYEVAARLRHDGIISVSVNPGLIKTELQRHQPKVVGIVMGLMFKPAKYGAYSELFAGWSNNVTISETGRYIIAWGRFAEIPKNIKSAFKDDSDGGNGLAKRFLGWCERETRNFA
jgi:retinol dehydrogenase 12